MEREKGDLSAKQEGHMTIMMVVIILLLTILTLSGLHLAKMQVETALVERNTHNTYYLVKSSIERQVASINEALEVECARLISHISKDYLAKLTEPITEEGKLMAMEGRTACNKYSDFYYDGKAIRLKDEVLQKAIQEGVYDFISKKYFNQKITYEVKGEQVGKDTEHTYKTFVHVYVKPLYKKDKKTVDKSRFKIIAEGNMRSPKALKNYDRQTIEAEISIQLPQDIVHQINENYKWAAHPPEILDSALTCFSDVVITEGGTLEVRQGDLKVKGSNVLLKSQFEDQIETLTVGGIVVSNGGKLEVDDGDIVCMNNIIVTNGWGNGLNHDLTSIRINKGDMIGCTIGFIGHTSKMSHNLQIEAGQNVFVSDDVRIGENVTASQIDVKGVIFGVNNGDETTYEGIQTALSSGVFAKGEDNQITAYRMFVSGQAYLKIEDEQVPMKLWESIGEPFEEILDEEGHRLEIEEVDLASIQTHQIQIRDDDIEGNSYAPQKVSANGRTVEALGTGMGISDSTFANKIFQRGFLNACKIPLSTYTNHHGAYEEVAYILSQTRSDAAYYKNVGANHYSWYKQKGMYGKNYTTTTSPISDYMGIEAYMVAKQSVFYGKMDDQHIPSVLNFNEVIGSLPKEDYKWQYHNPIEVHSEDADTRVDLKHFYVKEGGQEVPVPTILIYSGEGTLTLEGKAPYTHFKGIIISCGDVRIQGKVHIEGSLIIRGSHEGQGVYEDEQCILGTGGVGYSPGLVIKGKENCLILEKNTDMLLQVAVSDHAILRQILDALKITQYGKSQDIKVILGPYQEGKLIYTAGKVFYAPSSTLEIQTHGIKVQIDNLRKVI